MIEKIQALPYIELTVLESQFPEVGKWLRLLRDAIPVTKTYSPAIDVASVAATSESVQTFTVTGLSTADVVIVNKPTNSTGLDLVQAWVSATDTLSLKFRNVTASPIDPAAETYRIMAFRQ